MIIVKNFNNANKKEVAINALVIFSMCIFTVLNKYISNEK